MKKILLHLTCASLAFAALSSLSVRGAETLWDIKFKDLAGKPLTEVTYNQPCSGPQKVVTDTSNTLTGAATVGSLHDALAFTKGSKTSYTPAFTLQAVNGFTSGVITTSFDLTFDSITPSGDRPVETLMAIPFLNDQGAPAFVLLVGARGPEDLFLAGAGLPKGKQQLDFKKGDVVHVKVVLDLNKHTVQFFLNDIAYGDPVPDEAKLTGFSGLTVRDGSALGGNTGTTFTAGLANLLVTRD